MANPYPTGTYTQQEAQSLAWRTENKIKDDLVFSGESILEALRRINANQACIIFVVEDSGVLIGAVSDGDVRRWITDTASPPA